MPGRLRVGTYALAAALLGCSSSSSNGTPAGPGDASAEASAKTYASSACGACATKACASYVKTCNGDPGCAVYLSCLDACPVGASGGLDSTCAKSCSTGSSSASASDGRDLITCLSAGAGASSCSACGFDAGAAKNPIVNQTCTPMMDQTPCYVCEDDSCCQTYAACHADPDCTALEVCLKDCLTGVADDAGSPQGGAPDGGSCDLICGEAHPKGLVEWAPRLTCLTVLCAVQCENPPMPPLDPCEACVNQKCGNQYADIAGTPDGYLFDACFAACPSGANPCTNGCIAQYPSVQSQFLALGACEQLNCPVCNY